MATPKKELRLLLVPKFDLSDDDFGEGSGYAMGNTLKGYFTSCIQTTKFTSVDFWYDADAKSVTSDDLVCYLVFKPSRSVVQARGCTEALGAGGTTWWSVRDNAMISEVYFEATRGDANRTTLLANLIYHEWMHNRLDAGMHEYQDVHATPRGVLTTGGPISGRMAPNAVDITAMRRGLHHPIKQYAGW